VTRAPGASRDPSPQGEMSVWHTSWSLPAATRYRHLWFMADPSAVSRAMTSERGLFAFIHYPRNREKRPRPDRPRRRATSPLDPYSDEITNQDTIDQSILSRAGSPADRPGSARAVLPLMIRKFIARRAGNAPAVNPARSLKSTRPSAGSSLSEAFFCSMRFAECDVLSPSNRLLNTRLVGAPSATLLVHSPAAVPRAGLGPGN